MAVGGAFLVAVLIAASSSRGTAVQQQPAGPSLEQLSAAAKRLGEELWAMAKAASRRQEVHNSFKTARVVPREGHELLSSIVREIDKMLQMKAVAVQEIVSKAEELAENAWWIKNNSPFYHYRDAKRLNLTWFFSDEHIEVRENGHFFGQAVNTSYSAVQVPTNVYEGEPHIQHGITWSKGLDEVFVENYNRDPSLYWQYFGSSLGFMRRYPASWWNPKPKPEKNDKKETENADAFDCRTRNWYVEAATSPKDIMILVDNSGSMKGQKREIARQVAFEILDSLGSNDYVNVLSFNFTVREVVCCFKNRMVQANLANIRNFKMGLQGLEKALNTSEFLPALNEGFRILNETRIGKRGSSCNQALMIITDSAPPEDNFKEVFEAYNWFEPDKKPVRVFTYLIGSEADKGQLRDMKWIACANNGYFVNINTMAEVRELVLNYISVMARPLVLNNTYHPAAWAPVYADVVDPKITDFLWAKKENEIQKGITWMFRKTQWYRKWKNGDFKQKKYNRDKTIKEIANEAIKDEYLKDDREYLIDTKIKRYPYKLMMSVSMPVYDTMDNSSLEAKILGVAGTDVPNFEIQRLMIPHFLGVNGYAFMVTNNGYLLIHPELRPEFDVFLEGKIESILKPNYNNVDFMDVELPFNNYTEGEKFSANIPTHLQKTCYKDQNVDDRLKNKKKSYTCRRDDPNLLTLREELINQGNGSASMLMKAHYDGLRRVHYHRRNYYYTPIPETPFELVLALPDVYGSNRVEAKLDVKRIHAKGGKVADFFKGTKWKIHPQWYYCKYHYTDKYHFESPEKELLHFINKYTLENWKFTRQPRGTPEHYHCHLCEPFKGNAETSNYYCDRTLLLSLLYDAKATDWFHENISLPNQKSFPQLGLVLAFLATRSGLTRWHDVLTIGDEAGSKYIHFSEMYNSAIDESYYKRAVEQYYIDPHSFVYSVPFNAGDHENILITASHAIFSIDGSREAPAAVVGFQFLHSAFHTFFKNVTHSICSSHNYDCYILDNNGYIIASEHRHHTGKLFGEVEGAVMERMITDKLYRRIEIRDYQAVCFIHRPIQDEDEEDAKEREEKYLSNKLYINRTVPVSCQTKINLYTLNRIKLKYGISAINCSRPYFVKDISYSNLILVVVNSSCPLNRNIKLYAQHEEEKFEQFWCCKSERNLPRRNLGECSSYSDREKDMNLLCGEAPRTIPSLFVIILYIFNSFA